MSRLLYPTELKVRNPFGTDLRSDDSNGNRTRVTAVKGRCLNRLTMEPNNIYFLMKKLTE